MQKMVSKPLQFSNISKYKSEIYGISILWIVLFHARAMLNINFSFDLTVLRPLDAIIGYGNIGVEIFLLCSGIFLYFSYCNNKDLLIYSKRRLQRLFWPVLIISGPYWVYRFLIIDSDLPAFLSKMTMMDFWWSGSQQIWFVSFILVCYFIYPYINAYLFESKFANSFVRLLCLLTVTVLFTLVFRSVYPDMYNLVEIAVARFPVFFIGCYLGRFVYEKKTLPSYTNLICLALVVLSFFVLFLYVLTDVYLRWFFLVAAIPLTFVIVWVLEILHCKPLNKFFAFFGNISLSLYISHIVVIHLYKRMPFSDNRTVIHYLIIVIVSVVIAYLAELLIKLILKPKNKKA